MKNESLPDFDAVIDFSRARLTGREFDLLIVQQAVMRAIEGMCNQPRSAVWKQRITLGLVLANTLIRRCHWQSAQLALSRSRSLIELRLSERLSKEDILFVLDAYNYLVELHLMMEDFDVANDLDVRRVRIFAGTAQAASELTVPMARQLHQHSFQAISRLLDKL